MLVAVTSLGDQQTIIADVYVEGIIVLNAQPLENALVTIVIIQLFSSDVKAYFNNEQYKLQTNYF